MKKSRYTEEQVINAVKQMEAGRNTKEMERALIVGENGVQSDSTR